MQWAEICSNFHLPFQKCYFHSKIAYDKVDVKLVDIFRELVKNEGNLEQRTITVERYPTLHNSTQKQVENEPFWSKNPQLTSLDSSSHCHPQLWKELDIIRLTQ